MRFFLLIKIPCLTIDLIWLWCGLDYHVELNTYCEWSEKLDDLSLYHFCTLQPVTIDRSMNLNHSIPYLFEMQFNTSCLECNNMHVKYLYLHNEYGQLFLQVCYWSDLVSNKHKNVLLVSYPLTNILTLVSTQTIWKIHFLNTWKCFREV